MRSKQFIQRILFVLASAAVFSACGDGGGSGPDPTPTPIPTGPVITFFGLARADDLLITPTGMSDDGIPIYARPTGTGSGFRVVVEARRGESGLPVGQSSYDPNGGGFPDLQILSSRRLGDGSSDVCDGAPPERGGVPATSSSQFDESDRTIAAVNDLACRFVDGAGAPTARTSRDDSCVSFPTGDFAFVNPLTEVQYCGLMDVPLSFQDGDTLLTVRVRDTGGHVGPTQQLIVRVDN